MKQYKYFNKFNSQWEYTDSLSQAQNHSYYSQKAYYKAIPVKIRGKETLSYQEQTIPYKLNMGNVPTFHNHEISVLCW